MRNALGHTFAVVIRGGAVLGAGEGVAWIYARSEPDADPLGTGLTAMFLMLLVAALWGLVDGLRHSPLWLCLTWIGAGVVTSVGLSLVVTAQDGFDWAMFLTDLHDGGAFWTGLVFVPALCAGIVPAVLRGRQADGGAGRAHAPSQR